MSVRVCSAEDVTALLDLSALLDVVESAFVRQGRGEVERPDRPHYPIGEGLDESRPRTPLGTGLTMPAYIHGNRFTVTKLATVHEDNPERGLPTVQAQLVLQEADTGAPAGFMAGEDVTNARTGCIGGLAARHLAGESVALGLVGAGTQARWQARAVAAATDVERVRVFSPSDSREQCATDLRETGLDAEAVDTPRAAVTNADIVVTATTATEPVFPADALADGTVVVAVGAYTAAMQELAPAVFQRAARVFADVPAEVAETGDAVAAGLSADDFHPLSAVFGGEADREAADDVLVVCSVGTAVLDAAAAEHLFERAEERDIGTTVDL
ncbi:MAG: ornithine cyclodeaminase family protein [Haloglomus sp.]